MFTKPFFFTISFLYFGIINLFFHGAFNFFNLIGPIVAFLGYCFLFKKEIDLRIFDYFLIVLYIYYYFVYFSVLPDLFYRPGFDEDAIVFDNSSSNSIPMALNITLYSYMIMNRFYLETNNKKILIFATINLGLVVIQQSRIGLLVSIIIFFLAVFEYSKKRSIISNVSFLNFLVILFFVNYLAINEFIQVLGNLNGFEALSLDIRGDAQKSFFHNMNLSRFFFGFDQKFIFAEGSTGNIRYTYNVFLDMWNRYGLFQFIIFFVVLLFRIFRHSKFHFPLYFFIPFLAYSLIESIFFPNFWDCIIYLLLFTPKVGFPRFIDVDICRNDYVNLK